MKFLRYLILLLIICGLPTFFWSNYGEKVGNVFSTLLTGTLLIYYSSNKKDYPVIPFLILGLFYYAISGIYYSGPTGLFIKEAIKYIIFIVAGYEIAQRTTKTEFFVFLLISASSILVDALFFPNSYGRYAGFTINANGAGFICALAFSLVFTLKNRTISLICQGIIVICAILTFSRTALLLLTLIYFISIYNNRRNLIGLGFGAIAFIIIITSTGLKLNTVRLNAFKSIFSSEVDTRTLGEESRDETWALYTDMIMDNTVLGSGFNSMKGGKTGKSLEHTVGVHNTFLMIIGEAGIVPLIVIFIIYTVMFVKSLKYFKSKPELVFLSISVITFLLTTHNYFDNHIILFTSLWLYHQTRQPIVINQPKIS